MKRCLSLVLLITLGTAATLSETLGATPATSTDSTGAVQLAPTVSTCSPLYNESGEQGVYNSRTRDCDPGAGAC